MSGELIAFVCNVCDRKNAVPRDRLDREIPSCEQCGSSVRLRSIIYLLSRSLYAADRTLGEFELNKSITGIGLSDWLEYADRLERLFNYRNTYIHREPRVDILAPPSEMLGTLDFIISSDVFEHVLDPVQRAFDTSYSLLKPGGYLILTVPFGKNMSTIEHYRNIEDYAVVNIGSRICVVTIDGLGNLKLDPKPIFHGGDGATLEMRCFGEDDLLGHLTLAGFNEISMMREPVPAYGITFPLPWSLPILARKPLPATSSASVP